MRHLFGSKTQTMVDEAWRYYDVVERQIYVEIQEPPRTLMWHALTLSQGTHVQK